MVFLDRAVLAVFLVVLGAYFLPPLLTGGQLLYDSLAAPVWDLAVASGSAVGCGSLSCIPLILAIFLSYTYLLAVVLAGLFRGASAAIREASAD